LVGSLQQRSKIAKAKMTLKKCIYLALLLVALCLLLSGFRNGKERAAQAQTDSKENQYSEPLALIDKKAQMVGSDETSVRELTEAVFNTLGVSDVSAVLVDPFKERLTRAESNFLSRRETGIPEENIVRVVNDLAQRFDAPEYARTSKEEVRKLRLINSYLMPHFIVQHPPTENITEKRIGFSISETMSPLEAVFIARTLIYQKRYNQEFQLTRDQARLESNKNGQDQNPQEPQLGTINSPQNEEMAALFNRVMKMSPDDQLRVINESLSDLGIEK
jgi:hypothetical protein